jgi:hypothetical protein
MSIQLNAPIKIAAVFAGALFFAAPSFADGNGSGYEPSHDSCSNAYASNNDTSGGFYGAAAGAQEPKMCPRGMSDSYGYYGVRPDNG